MKGQGVFQTEHDKQSFMGTPETSMHSRRLLFMQARCTWSTHTDSTAPGNPDSEPRVWGEAGRGVTDPYVPFQGSCIKDAGRRGEAREICSEARVLHFYIN